MRLTTKGRYAVTAMIDIAINGENNIISLSDISKRNDISPTYLEQLFVKLRHAGLVVSIRGSTGGYKLNMKPEDITVSQIILAVDEDMRTTKCDGSASCRNGQSCLAHNLWVDLSAHIFQFLNSVTLASLAQSDTNINNLIEHISV